MARLERQLATAQQVKSCTSMCPVCVCDVCVVCVHACVCAFVCVFIEMHIRGYTLRTGTPTQPRDLGGSEVA